MPYHNGYVLIVAYFPPLGMTLQQVPMISTAKPSPKDPAAVRLSEAPSQPLLLELQQNNLRAAVARLMCAARARQLGVWRGAGRHMGVPQRLLVRPVRSQSPDPMRSLAACRGSGCAPSQGL